MPAVRQPRTWPRNPRQQANAQAWYLADPSRWTGANPFGAQSTPDQIAAAFRKPDPARFDEAQRINQGGFTPYNAAAPPPPGSYLGELDAQWLAAQRGLGYVRDDYDRDWNPATGRGPLSAQLADDRIMQQFSRNERDLDTSRSESLADLLTGKTRATEDHGTAIAGLDRDYMRLQRRQGEGMRRAGVLSEGIAAQAARIREQNKAWDRRGIDRSLERFLADNQKNVDRVESRYQEGTRRNTEQREQSRGDVWREFGWNRDDAQTGITRAENENVAFGLDVNNARWEQAAQQGYTRPPKPSNEFVSPGGVPYRVVLRNGQREYVGANGKKLPGRPA